MKRVVRSLDRVIAYLGYAGVAMSGISIAPMMMLVVVNVILRAMDMNIPMVEEISAYLMVFLVYMGLAYTARSGGHIRVDLLVRHLSKIVRGRLETVTSLIILGVVAVLLWYSWEYWMATLSSGELSRTGILLPLWIPRTFLWVGTGLLFLQVAISIVIKLIGRDKELAR